MTVLAALPGLTVLDHHEVRPVTECTGDPVF